MTEGKKQPAKKATGKKSASAQKPAKGTPVAAKQPPKHPLMKDGKDWNRAAVMDFLLTRIATSSHGIAKILRVGYEHTDGQLYNLPNYSVIMDWLNADAELANKYAQAKDAQCEFMADELVQIADESGSSPGAVAKARLQTDVRKWVAAKLKPKKYGDKLQMGGDPENPLKHEHSGRVGLEITPEEAYKRMLEGG